MDLDLGQGASWGLGIWVWALETNEVISSELAYEDLAHIICLP